MPFAWFLCPYLRRTDPEGLGRAMRYCAMNDFTATIRADGGKWAEAECLGGICLVKVSASSTTLTTIAGTAGFVRIPNHFDLNDTLADLSSAQRTAILNKLTSMGYSTAEISAALGSNLTGWRTRTLRQLLNFALTRHNAWVSPFVDGNGDLQYLGSSQAGAPVDLIDGLVS